MRNITLGDTVYFNFTTRAFATGLPTSLLGTPALSVLEENNATPITAGVSVQVDRASVAGLNQATVVATTGNTYEAGKQYALYISAGTVAGDSAVGEVVAEFTVNADMTYNSLTVVGELTVQDGVDISCTTTNKHGFLATGDGTGEGIRGAGGATGHGILGITSGAGVNGIHGLSTTGGAGIGAQGGGANPGIDAVGGGTIGGHGIVGTGGAAGGDGFRGVGTAGTTDGDGMQLLGAGDAAGLEINGGPTGPGLEVVGGATSGNGLDITVTSGTTFNYNGTELSAEINAQCDASIETYHLDHLLAADYDPASKPGVATALLNEIVENDAGVSRFTTNSLENAPGGTPSSALLQSTVISGTPTSNAQFILTAGSSDNDAYNNQMCVIKDASVGEQKAVGLITDYIGSTKEVFLDVDPLPTFTFASGDTVEIWAVSGSQTPLEVDANGRVDVGNVAGTVQTAGDLKTLIDAVQTTASTIDSNLENGTDGLSALSADIAAVDGKVNTAQADLNILTDTDGVIIGSAAEAQLVDAVMDETLTSHVTADSLGVAIKDTLADTSTDGVVIAAAQTVATVTDVTNLHASAATAASITALNDISVADILTTQMTEAYAADGVAPTMAQALFLIQQSVGDFEITGTTLTVRELDGVTTAATYTLDDSADPTDRTRAT